MIAFPKLYALKELQGALKEYTLSFLSLFFWISLFFFPCEEFLVFLSVFPFFSRDFRGSVGIKNPCFFGGFPRVFQKKQGKEGQGTLPP